jgi:ABC-type transport system substrate-binding protein
MDSLLSIFTTNGAQQIGYTWYSNPKVDQLMEQARSTVDTQQRYNLYNEAEKLILTDAQCIPLYTYGDFRVSNTKRIGGFSYNLYAQVDMWKVWVK